MFGGIGIVAGNSDADVSRDVLSAIFNTKEIGPVQMEATSPNVHGHRVNENPIRFLIRQRQQIH